MCYRAFSISFETRQTGDESILKTAFRWWWEWWWRWRVLINFFPSPSWLTHPTFQLYSSHFKDVTPLPSGGRPKRWKFIPHYNFVCVCVCDSGIINLKLRATRIKKDVVTMLVKKEYWRRESCWGLEPGKMMVVSVADGRRAYHAKVI